MLVEGCELIRFLRISGFGILGTLLGLCLWIIQDMYFQTWQELSTSPSQTIELYPGGTVEIFSPESWASHPEYRITKPCDTSSREFSSFSNHPKNILDCIQVTYVYGPEYLIESTYVLDSNGKIWKWPADSARYGWFFMISGLIIGCGFALLLNRRTVKRRSSE